MNELELLITDINEPFKRIDVSIYDSIFIDGYKFPCKTHQTKNNLPLKPPQNYSGMIDRLKNEVTFDDGDEILAIEILKRINYYKLSIFTKLLKELSKD